MHDFNPKHQLIMGNNFLRYGCLPLALFEFPKGKIKSETISYHEQIDFWGKTDQRKLFPFLQVFTSKQKFKSICWIFPVKTQMQMNWFDFTCQNTNFFQIKFAFWQEKSRKLCWILYFDRKNPAKWLAFFFDVKIY